MSTQEQYDSVCAAIASIEGGAQEYSIGSRKVRRGDLSVLYSERRTLRAELAAADSSGMTITSAIFDGR